MYGRMETWPAPGPQGTIEVYVCPRLYEDPPDGDWIAWTKQQCIQRGQPLKKEVKKGTISGGLMETTGPAWANALAVNAAVAGELQTPAAQEVRAQFLSGKPFSLLPYNSFERFPPGVFVPVVRHSGDGQYILGYGPREQPLVAQRGEPPLTESLALRRARDWFLRSRTAVIEALRGAAKQRAKAQSTLVLDLYEAYLHRYKNLLNADGIVVVEENHAHNMFAVEGRTFSIAVMVAYSVAVQLYLQALEDRQEKPYLIPVEEGVSLLAQDGWQATNDGYCWNGGSLAGGLIYTEGTAVARLTLQPGHVVATGREKTILAEGRAPVPTSTDNSDKAVREAQRKAALVQELLAAWAVHRVLLRFQRKQKREA